MAHLRFAIIAFGLLTAFLVCTTAQAWAQSPFPDSLRFADNGTPIRAGQNYTIVLQVMLEGGDYPKGNIGIYLQSDNSSILDIPETAVAVTNQTGVALYNLTSDKVKPGKAIVTAILLDKRTGARVSKAYAIAQIGDITGNVTAATGEPVPGASVAVYEYVNGTRQLLPVSGNPATAIGNDSGIPGFFRMMGVPYGIYFVEASYADKVSGINYTFGDFSQPVYITIAGYSPATPTPLPTPTPGPSRASASVATHPTAAVTPTATPSSGDSTKQVFWIGGLALALALLIIAVVLLTRKKE